MHSNSSILLDIVSRLADMQQQIGLMKTCQDKSNMEIQSIKKDLANISSFLIPRMTHSEANRNGLFGMGFPGPEAKEAFSRHPGAYMANQYWPDPRSAQLYSGLNPFLMYGHPFVYPDAYYKPATNSKEYEYNNNTNMPSTAIPQTKSPAPPFLSSEGSSTKQFSSNLEVPQQDLNGRISYPEQTINRYRPPYKRDRQMSSTSNTSTYSKKTKKIDKQNKPHDSINKKNKLPNSYLYDTDEESQASFEDSDPYDGVDILDNKKYKDIRKNHEISKEKPKERKQANKVKFIQSEYPKNDANSVSASGLQAVHVSPKKPIVPETEHSIQKNSGRQMLNSKATLAQGDFFALASSKKVADTSLNSITSENPADYNNNVIKTQGTPLDPRSIYLGVTGTKKAAIKKEKSATQVEKPNDDSEGHCGYDFDRKKSIIIERENRPKGIWEMNPISHVMMFNFEKNSKQKAVKKVPNQSYKGLELSRTESISSGISCLSGTDNITDSEDETAIDQKSYFEYMKENKSNSDLELTNKEMQTSECAFFNNDYPVVDPLLKNKGLSDKQLVKLEV